MESEGTTGQQYVGQKEQTSEKANLFSYKGRIRRRDYAVLLIVSVAFWLLTLGFAVMRLGGDIFSADDIVNVYSSLIVLRLPLYVIYVFVCFQTAKRLHDIGWSGWFCLLPYIQLPLLFIEGEEGPNRYGPAPKERGPAPSDQDLENSHDQLFVRPFSFRGRIRRTEYNLTVLILLICSAGLSLMCYWQYQRYEMQSFSFVVAYVTSALLLVPLVWFGLAQGVKRLHDVGLSGWLVLAGIFSLALMIVPSQGVTNRWGSCPMRGATEIPPAWEVEPAADGTVRMFRRPFSFRGRIRRTEYAISLLIMSVVLVVWMVALLVIVGASSATLVDMEGWPLVVSVLVFLLTLFPLFWFYYAQTAKRLHDIDAPGLFCFVNGLSLPMIFVEGSRGANRYGALPKEYAVKAAQPELSEQ